MAQLNREFAPVEGVEQKEYSGFGPLPDGNYILEIESSKPSDWNIPDELFILDAVFSVIKPEELKDRKIFGSYRLEDIKNTGWADEENLKFTFLCNAIGHVGKVNDSEVLHFRSFAAKVVRSAYKKKNGDDGVKNKIVYYYDPGKDNEPVIGVFEEQPELKPSVKKSAVANDNARPAANDNKAAAAAPAKKPWGTRK